LNYELIQTYYDSTLYKTNASPEVIYDILKQWKIKNAKNDKNAILKNINKQSPAYAMFEKPPQVDPNFDYETAK